MSIDPKEVLHIARLANLEFTDSEYDQFTRQLNEILDYVAQLDRLDTSDVEPTAQVADGSSTLREDQAGGSIDPEDALANAPDAESVLFKVPKVIG